MRIQDPLAVGIGGVCGALLRYWISGLIPTNSGSFPFATFIINLSGSFILGFFLSLAQTHLKVPKWLRLFLATGLIGSYTTFSSFSAETLALWREGFFMTGILYSLLSLIGGMLSVWAGVEAGQIKASR